jgi:hypothetical protein
MSEGRRVAEATDLAQAQEFCRSQIASLPIQVIENGADYPVAISENLQQLTDRVQRGLRAAIRPAH